MAAAFPARAQVVLNEVCADNGGNALSPSGLASDYIEVCNTTTQTVRLSGWSLTDDDKTPAKFVFPADATIPARGVLVVWLESAPHVGALVATNFSLKAAGEQVALYQGTIRRDLIKFGPQMSGRSVGRVPDGTGSWVLGSLTPGSANLAVAASMFGIPAALRINEWMATNSAGATFDWVELYNPKTNGIVAIGGLVLSDIMASAATPVTTAAILPYSYLGSGEFLRFWCDGTTDGGNHLAFKLSSTSGETLTLYQANRSSIIDRVSFGPQSVDVSMGRLPDGGPGIFYFSGPDNTSPGSANVWQPSPGIVVSEVLAHTDPPLEDAIELQNLTGSPIDISYWYLSNDEDNPFKFRIPAGTVVPAGGFRVFYEQNALNGVGKVPGFNASGTGNAPDFTLNSAHGDAVVITEALASGVITGRRSSRHFGATLNGISLGRYVKSDGGTDLVPMAQRTFGVDAPLTVAQFRSGGGRSNSVPAIGPLVISEIMYHPPGAVVAGVTNNNTADEFIEISSIIDTVQPLYHAEYPWITWRVTGGAEFTFPTAQVVPPRGRLVLVGFDPATNAVQLAEFRARYGMAADVAIYGPYTGSLDNTVDTVQLERPDAVQLPPHPDAGFVPYALVEKVKYEDSNGWPSGADGQGLSIHRRSLTSFANDPESWVAAAPNPGLGDGSTPVAPPKLEMRGLGSDGRVRLRVTSTLGVAGRVEVSAGISPGIWTTLASFPGDAIEHEVSDSLPVDQVARFYRAVLVP